MAQTPPPAADSEPPLQRAALDLLMRERLVATVNGRSGEVVTANARFGELVGRSEEEAAGQPLSDLWHTSAAAVDRLLDGARAGEYLEELVVSGLD